MYKFWIFPIYAIQSVSALAGANLLRNRSSQDVQDPTIAIDRYTLEGNGCPDKTSGSIKYLDSATLTLIFDKFEVFNFPGKTDQLTSLGCDIFVYLSFAGNFEYGELQDVIRGDTDFGQNANGSLVLGYLWSVATGDMPVVRY
jgi:hypothetical protein